MKKVTLPKPLVNLTRNKQFANAVLALRAVAHEHGRDSDAYKQALAIHVNHLRDVARDHIAQAIEGVRSVNRYR